MTGDTRVSFRSGWTARGSVVLGCRVPIVTGQDFSCRIDGVVRARDRQYVAGF